jgi:recombination protein RecA
VSSLFYSLALSEDQSQAIRRLRLKTVRAQRETPEDRKKLSMTLKAIHKQWGADVLSPIKLIADRHDVPCVSTGLQDLDDIISGRTEKKDGKRRWIKGSGRGIPRGRIIEIFGPESSGKTTLGLELIARYQERGFVTSFVDLEHAVDLDYADRIGCDVESWLYSQGGDTAEETFEMLHKLVESNTVDLIIVDSVAALVPAAELKGEVGDQFMGLHARLMSQGLRKLTRLLKRGHRTTIVFINQTRSKIGGYGNPETTTGGNALRFYASVRLRISNAGEIKAGGEKGIRSKVKARKTKLCVPYGECFLDITGGDGISACYSANARAKKKGDDDDDDDEDE